MNQSERDRTGRVKARDREERKEEHYKEMGVFGTTTSSSQLRAPFPLHFCLTPFPPRPSAPFLFPSFPFTLSPCSSARGILYICCVTLFVFDAFQLLSSSGCVLFFFVFPSALLSHYFQSHPILSFSLHDSLFLQELQSCTVIVILHTDTQKQRMANRPRQSGRKGG